MADEESREVPTGEAKKLGELAREKWREHLLLFSRVKNTVLEVNPYVDTPVRLEEGKPSPLGLFAEAAFGERPGELPKGKRILEVWPKVHRRSALLGRVIFADKEGRIYRGIDLKGIGFVSAKFGREEEAMVLVPGRELGEGMGLLDRDSAFFERQMSEEFLRTGIRTYRVLAIIELKELIVNGRKLSLKEAIKRDIFNEDFHPVVEVRAFGTKIRIADFNREVNEDRRRLLFEDAKRLVSQELGYKRPISTEEYFTWFAKTLGYNVGLMHKNGWYHGNLTPHNITLDCRFCDLDTVASLTEESEQGGEFKTVEYVLQNLLQFLDITKPYRPLRFLDVENTKKAKSLVRQFQKSYDSVFPPEERKRYFSKVSKER